jgi:hypothetical protein
MPNTTSRTSRRSAAENGRSGSGRGNIWADSEALHRALRLPCGHPRPCALEFDHHNLVPLVWARQFSNQAKNLFPVIGAMDCVRCPHAMPAQRRRVDELRRPSGSKRGRR